MFTAFSPHTGRILEVHQPPQGCNFQVTLLASERGKFIVKTGDTAAKIEELAQEAGILTALAPYQPLLPAFVAREADHFLFTYLEGTDLATAANAARATSGFSPTRNYPALAREYGRGLRTIHDTFLPDLPHPADWLGQAVEQCACNLAKIDANCRADEHSIHAGRSFGDLLALIERERGGYTTTLRFCHGDWCLPNVLVNEGRFAGAVDWSNGGYKDYRFDLATGLWSLRRNGLRGYEEDFLQAYGYEGSVQSLAFFEAIYMVYGL